MAASKPRKQQGLFAAAPARPAMVIAHIDGGARGNPGPAGYGVVFHDARGARLAELSAYLGIQTNNCAEYRGLVAALEHALAQGYRELGVVSDSELLVRQMNGRYKVRSPQLRPLFEQARALALKFEYFEIRHARREENKAADGLANRAMDAGR